MPRLAHPGCAPDTAEHSLVLGGRLGDGPLGAHDLHGVLLLSAFAVLALVELGFRHAVLPQDLWAAQGQRGPQDRPKAQPRPAPARRDGRLPA